MNNDKTWVFSIAWIKYFVHSGSWSLYYPHERMHYIIYEFPYYVNRDFCITTLILNQWKGLILFSHLRINSKTLFNTHDGVSILVRNFQKLLSYAVPQMKKRNQFLTFWDSLSKWFSSYQKVIESNMRELTIAAYNFSWSLLYNTASYVEMAKSAFCFTKENVNK